MKRSAKPAPARKRGIVQGVDWLPVLLNGQQIGIVRFNNKAWGDRWDEVSRILADYADAQHGGEFNDGRNMIARRSAAIDRFLEVRGLEPDEWTLNDNNAKLDAAGFHLTMPTIQDKKNLDDACKLVGL